MEDQESIFMTPLHAHIKDFIRGSYFGKKLTFHKPSLKLPAIKKIWHYKPRT